ncbi:MAG: sugar ABC transporter permease [Lachnospiraceae bacterium]|nr:sugar ABC transporter permease [Lachnospiraceae bacterium]
MENNILERDGSSKNKVIRTSVLFMGLSHIIYFKQYVKGALFAILEILMFISLPFTIGKLADMVTLGEPQPELPIKERSNSIFMLIDGVMVLMIVLLFVIVYIISVKSALYEYKVFCITGEITSNKMAVKQIFGKSFPIAALAPAVLLVVFFVIVPLVFSAAVAFTDYSSPGHIPPNNTVNWVGFKNFSELFGGSNSWTTALGRVAIWTIVWAVFATFTCFAFGMLIAVVLKEARIKIAPVFRVIFILPYAVPSVISMLVWTNLLNGSFGIVNKTLQQIGISGNIPWLSDPFMAKVSCILINLWAGFPYFMLLVMGNMTSISEDLYEAARIDGASVWMQFKKITFPLVIFQTAPLLIMGFTHNVNNFGAIYFLTNGNPVVADTTVTNAGGTDILITWIYNLTMNALKYNYASVIAVMIFVIMAPFAIWNFKNTKSYKEGEL